MEAEAAALGEHTRRPKGKAGRPFAEETVLRIGHGYERATPWHDRHPDLERTLQAFLKQDETAKV